MRLANLLPLLLMESSNEAAQAIASYLGPVRFVDLMNRKARARLEVKTAAWRPASHCTPDCPRLAR